MWETWITDDLGDRDMDDWVMWMTGDAGPYYSPSPYILPPSHTLGSGIFLPIFPRQCSGSGRLGNLQYMTGLRITETVDNWRDV